MRSKSSSWKSACERQDRAGHRGGEEHGLVFVAMQQFEDFLDARPYPDARTHFHEPAYSHPGGIW